MGMKNTLSLHFVKTMIKLVVVGLMVLGLNIGLVVWGINNQFLLAANEPINLAEGIKSNIENADNIDPRTIPTQLDYTIINKQTNEIIDSNMSKQKQEKAIRAFQESSKKQVESFIRLDSQYEAILIYYNLKVQFANEELRKAFPNPGVWITTLSILVYSIYLVQNIRSFSRVVVQENEKLIKVAGKIKERDLNIEFPKIAFSEYQDVMNAMESLAEALTISIQKEIEATNSKREQISYLIHDIKIPLTVIKGNTELLEMMSTEEMNENLRDVMNAVKQIEQYIQDVIDINLNDKRLDMNKQEISMSDFLSKLKSEVIGLGNNIVVEDYAERELILFVDVNLLIRAIDNIVLNAVERTPKHEEVRLIAKIVKNVLRLTIIDRGPGFSEEALKKGTDLFYTDNDGRTSNHHYGLGLTFTDNVIKQHNGQLQLRNNESNSGEVLVELPLDFKGN